MEFGVERVAQGVVGPVVSIPRAGFGGVWPVISILRTIAIIDIATNAVLAAVAWLFGMTVTQTVGAGLVALIVLAVVLGWRAVVNAPRKPRHLHTDWQHLSADHVDQLPTPRAVAEIVAPQRPQIEAPRREIQVP